MMIPLSDDMIVPALTLTRLGRPGSLKGALAFKAARRGRIARFIPCFSVLGQRQ